MIRNRKPKQWTQAEVQLLVEMAKQGASTSEIAAALQRYTASVKRVARDMCLLLKK
jgi:methyl-accepting chemotaxis protein